MARKKPLAQAAPSPAVEQVRPGRRRGKIDRASCSPQARAYALQQRGLRCAGCGSYEVVPKKGESGDYTCCTCGRSGDFNTFVRISRR